MSFLENALLFFNIWRGATWNDQFTPDRFEDDLFTRYMKHIDYMVDDEPRRMFIAYVFLEQAERIMIRFKVVNRLSLKVFYTFTPGKKGHVDFSKILLHILERSDGITLDDVEHDFMIASMMMEGNET